MAELWTSFARTGTPAAVGVPKLNRIYLRVSLMQCRYSLVAYRLDRVYQTNRLSGCTGIDFAEREQETSTSGHARSGDPYWCSGARAQS